MSGKRQHYIPRFLLKGFASRIQGEKVFTWYFRNGNRPKDISIRDVAATPSFYGKPGAETLDDKITQQEDVYASLIARIRERARVDHFDVDLLVDLICLMVTRTRNLRSGMIAVFREIVSGLAVKMADPGQAIRLVRSHIDRNPEEFREQLRNWSRRILGCSNLAIENFVIQTIESNKDEVVEQFAPIASSMVSPGIGKFLDNIEDIGASSHQKALKRFLAMEDPSERFKEYRSLHWTIVDDPSGSLILGDATVLEWDVSTNEIYNAAFNTVSNGTLLFPISNRFLLVGSPNASSTVPTLSDVNAASAELSAEFFVSSCYGEAEQRYFSRLGTRASLLSKEKIKTDIEDVFAEDD